MIAIGEKDAYNQEEVDEHAPRPRSLMGKRELERKKKKKGTKLRSPEKTGFLIEKSLGRINDTPCS